MVARRAANSKPSVAPRARMIDIARKAGVSQPTVSYVLNGGKGSQRISVKTADRVRRIAKRLKFHPNQAAKQLAGKRSGIVGALAKTWFWQTEQRTLGWLNQLASDREFKILAWQMESRTDALEAFVDECIGWNVDGLIFIAYKYDTVWPLVSQALKRLPRVVSILGNPGIAGGYAVEVDAADGVRQCVEHLYAQGRRRIVQVLEGLDAQMDRRRYDAFLAAHDEFYGAAADKDQVCVASAGWKIDDHAKYEELARELVVDRRADAILADSDFSAPGLVRGLARLGRSIPAEVALIGWGYENMSRGVTPLLTTVDFDFEQIVGRTFDLLTGLIERPDEEHPSSIVVKPRLLVRESA